MISNKSKWYLIFNLIFTIQPVQNNCRYGIKKLSGVHRRTKALKKLDMSRCQLSQNGFYELIPIILKSEHVILQVKIIIDCQSRIFIHVIFSTQGNQITPLELKIFSGQLRWIFKYWILNIKYWIFHQNTISLKLERLSVNRPLHLLTVFIEIIFYQFNNYWGMILGMLSLKSFLRSCKS